MNATALIRAEFHQGNWAVIDPDTQTLLVVDQLLMDVDQQGDGFAVGTVLAVHGLSHETAATLSPRMLRALGIGFPNRIGRTPRGCARVRCIAGKSRPVRA